MSEEIKTAKQYQRIAARMEKLANALDAEYEALDEHEVLTVETLRTILRTQPVPRKRRKQAKAEKPTAKVAEAVKAAPKTPAPVAKATKSAKAPRAPRRSAKQRIADERNAKPAPSTKLAVVDPVTDIGDISL